MMTYTQAGHAARMACRMATYAASGIDAHLAFLLDRAARLLSFANNLSHMPPRTWS